MNNTEKFWTVMLTNSQKTAQHPGPQKVLTRSTIEDRASPPRFACFLLTLWSFMILLGGVTFDAQKRKRTTDTASDSAESNSNQPSRTRDGPKKKKANRACFHCQKAHLTCDDCESFLDVYITFVVGGDAPPTARGSW